MFISKSNAKKIVLEMKGIIHQQINMMDEKGYIIASTDPEREQHFHAGALKIINQKLDQILVEKDDEYEGTKKGINLPILFNGEIIGVIGITGDVVEVAKYGRIIKRMTEILLLDAYAKEQQNIQENLRAHFLKQWVYGKFSGADKDFVSRGKIFGIDVTKPFRALTAAAVQSGSTDDQAKIQMLYKQIFNELKSFINESEGDLLFLLDGNFVCLVSLRNDEKMKMLAEQFSTQVKSDFGLTLAIGIDSAVPEAKDVPLAYTRAKKALRASLSSPDLGILLYSEINVGILIDDIPQNTRKEFVRQIFRGCDEKEIRMWSKILTVFFEVDGSINLAAGRLFMHKNTLQYKLNKLSATTGYNPRKLSDAALFYLALQFLK